ncbi:MAG TPA: hypothetical protein VJV78_14695 [Polyangiales bacterium]|nr:hypothetical protein [Polyangiales bacterium]
MRTWSLVFLGLLACGRSAVPLEVDAGVDADGSAEPAEPVCGNDRVERGEQCDGRAELGATCRDLGFAGDGLGCDADCQYDTSRCRRAQTTCPKPDAPVSLSEDCERAMCACDPEAFSHCDWDCWSKVACQVATCNNAPLRIECAVGCANATLAELSLGRCYEATRACTRR